jgi:4-amino-4-deoxy-L-arabinose transferase-like glycosyltransferase
LRHVAFIAALTLASALLRLIRLGETPGWDGDEGYNLEIARQLADGHAQAFAVSQTFVQHPVGFYALLAPLTALSGSSLVVARALPAIATSLVPSLLYLAARHALGTRAAALGSLAFAVAHFIVLHNRLAYTYNLLVLWTALALWCVTRAEQTRDRRWWLAAAIAAAGGMLTDQIGIALPAFVGLRALPEHRWAALLTLGGMAPAVVFHAVMAVIDPMAALGDWSTSLGRVTGDAAHVSGGPGGPGVRIAQWFGNYFHLLRAEWWWPAALAGLFCIAELNARRRLLTLMATLIVPIFALRELDPFFRTAIPLFVPGALGLGALLDAGLSAIYRTVPGRIARSVVAALVVGLPLGLEAARSSGAVATSFVTRFDWALVTDQEDARRAAAFVDQQAGSHDVVLVSPHVAWLYSAHTADFFQAVAVGGDAIAFYPAGLPRARFVFDPSPASAHFAVIDPFWRRWSAASAPLASLTATIESWPEVLRAGDVSVRRNPRPA